MRARNREHFWEAGTDGVRLIAHAARDNHPAIFGNRFANGFKAFFLCTVKKAAGVDQHDICARIIGRQAIAIGAQFGENTFAIDQRFRAAEGDHAHFGRIWDLGKRHD